GRLAHDRAADGKVRHATSPSGARLRERNLLGSGASRPVRSATLRAQAPSARLCSFGKSLFALPQFAVIVARDFVHKLQCAEPRCWGYAQISTHAGRGGDALVGGRRRFGGPERYL